ncbi:helix-turn-helix domain-containing protein [Actinoplanes sp. CA-054009]
MITISVGPGPMVRRQQLGATLRKYRLEAELSVREVADHLMCHPAKISRMENAKRNISPRDVRDLCGLYRISDPAVRDQLMRLARESRESAWWQQFDLSPAQEKFFGIEGAADRISDFQIGAVSGLLQTRDYATAIVDASIPENPVKVKNIVDMRMMRQEFVGLNADYRSILDESALRRAVGGPAVMRDQINHLVTLMRSSGINLRIIPFSHGAHQGMVSGFTLLQFDDSATEPLAPAMSDVVYLEGLMDGVYLDRVEDVADYVAAFERLESIALSTAETIDFLVAMTSN